MPSIAIRGFAELMHLPAYEQIRILTEQKNPRQGAGQFRVPYYRPALTAIRRYYEAGNDVSILRSAVIDLQAKRGLQSRTDHNVRVLDSFRNGRQAERQITVLRNRRVTVSVRSVEIRLQFDLTGRERNKDRYIFYNVRAAPLDAEIARTTLEVSHWILEQNGISVPLRNVQYVDLFRNQVLNGPARRRARTLQIAHQNARVISALWEQV